MKKLIFILCILFAATVPVSVQAQQMKFYYYPQSNVYYDPGKKHYIYLENGTWTTVGVLPKKVTIWGIPRVAIYGNDSKIWLKNSDHVVKYKNHPNGKAVGYKGTNPNKAQGKTAHKKTKQKS